MQHSSSVRFLLDHHGQLLGMVVIRARSVHTHTPMSVHCSTGLGYTPGYGRIPQPSGAMDAKSRVRPVAYWAEKLDRVLKLVESIKFPGVSNDECLNPSFNPSRYEKKSYCPLIYPHFTYGIEVWGDESNRS